MGAEHEASEQRAYHFFEGKGQKNTKKQEAIIPVVIHILHDDGTENITDAQVSRALQPLAHFIKPIRPGALANAQFPPVMQDATGQFHKPARW